jgi:MYXO-CTERM domain-containing protein
MVPPALTSYDFGRIDAGNVANLEIPAENVGLLGLQGTATIEGDPSFTVFPPSFYAAPGATDGLVVTYAPSAEGETTALLVLETNDPLHPRLEIPLKGNARPAPPETGGRETVRVSVSTCGCDAAPAAVGWPLVAGALLFLRRRRR